MAWFLTMGEKVELRPWHPQTAVTYTWHSHFVASTNDQKRSEGRDQLGVPGSGSMRWSPAQVFSAALTQSRRKMKRIGCASTGKCPRNRPDLDRSPCGIYFPRQLRNCHPQAKHKQIKQITAYENTLKYEEIWEIRPEIHGTSWNIDEHWRVS